MTIQTVDNSIEIRVTLMMFSVVAMFVLQNLNPIIRAILLYGGIRYKTFLIWCPVCHFVTILNSSINILFYIHFCKTFRNNFFAIFPWFKKETNVAAPKDTKIIPQLKNMKKVKIILPA